MILLSKSPSSYLFFNLGSNISLSKVTCKLFQIANEGDFRSLCTVTFWQKVRLLSTIGYPSFLEKWFQKSASANSNFRFICLVNHFAQTRFLVDLYHKTNFFSGQPLFWKHTIFLESYFLNQIFKKCKSRGSRIKGWEGCWPWRCRGCHGTPRIWQIS